MYTSSYLLKRLFDEVERRKKNEKKTEGVEDPAGSEGVKKPSSLKSVSSSKVSGAAVNVARPPFRAPSVGNSSLLTSLSFKSEADADPIANRKSDNGGDDGDGDGDVFVPGRPGPVTEAVETVSGMLSNRPGRRLSDDMPDSARPGPSRGRLSDDMPDSARPGPSRGRLSDDMPDSARPNMKSLRNGAGGVGGQSMRERLLDRSGSVFADGLTKSKSIAVLQNTKWTRLRGLLKRSIVARAFGYKTADGETLLANRLKMSRNGMTLAGGSAADLAAKAKAKAEEDEVTENPKLALKVSVAAGNVCVILAGGGVEDDIGAAEEGNQRWEFLIGDPLPEPVNERYESTLSELERKKRAEARKGVFDQIASVEGAADSGDVARGHPLLAPHSTHY